MWHVKIRNSLSTEGVAKDTSSVDYNLVVVYSDALLVFGVDGAGIKTFRQLIFIHCFFV